MIQKEAKIEKLLVDDLELEAINQNAMETLTSEKLFVFKIAICDNEVDRSYEVFPTVTLKEMAVLFVGTTILKDHTRKTDNQVARIYKCEVVEKGGDTRNGEKYAQLVANCYMVKTENNKDLIAEIQGGIKKEVSVSCNVSSAVCSICGADIKKDYCKHYPSEKYDGVDCYFKLMGVKDAYEVSFVAVPCQPSAGVVKSLQENNETKQKEELIANKIKAVGSFILDENTKFQEEKKL